ncbi:hypothetical protein AGLY_010821 [Aphis glycines]|uniref:Uncharacterized protein n=1 Tax=Aphis glycines TaxID=307491 RepID=A0A6G0TET6_APHGL|nr:hypothetical protein AGLY_010821 [Aphis glycines]
MSRGYNPPISTIQPPRCLRIKLIDKIGRNNKNSNARPYSTRYTLYTNRKIVSKILCIKFWILVNVKEWIRKDHRYYDKNTLHFNTQITFTYYTVGCRSTFTLLFIIANLSVNKYFNHSWGMQSNRDVNIKMDKKKPINHGYRSCEFIFELCNNESVYKTFILTFLNKFHQLTFLKTFFFCFI